MQSTALATKHSRQTTGKPDPLKDCVSSIVLAMTSDYGEVFKRTFSNDDEIRNLKRRLYAKLRGIAVDCIIDGYEACVAETPRFCPTVPDIVSHVFDIAKQRKKAIENKNRADQMAALPAVPALAQPERVIAALRQAQQTPTGTDEQRAKKLADLLQLHEALIAVDKAKGLIVRSPDISGHLCAVEHCMDAGVIAHGRGGSFFCAQHFRA